MRIGIIRTLLSPAERACARCCAHATPDPEGRFLPGESAMRWTATLLCMLALALFPAPSPAQSGGRIAGTVTESGAGRPLPNVTVTVAGTERRGVTGADGRYTIADVPAGSRTLSIAAMGYGTVQRTVT